MQKEGNDIVRNMNDEETLSYPFMLTTHAECEDTEKERTTHNNFSFKFFLPHQ